MLFINLFADYRRPPEILDGLPPEVRLAGAPAERVGVETLERVVGADTDELRVGVETEVRVFGTETLVRVEGVTTLERVLLFPFGRLKVETADVRLLLTLLFGWLTIVVAVLRFTFG